MSSLAGGTEDRKPVDRLLLNADLLDKSPDCYTINAVVIVINLFSYVILAKIHILYYIKLIYYII